MKYHIINLIRSLGLLKIADTVKYWQHRMRTASSNRVFQRENPDFPVPPHDLAFDAYNHADWKGYLVEGHQHACVFARIMKENFSSNNTRVMEWGCGPGRVIRHMPELLQGQTTEIVGTDYNPRSISWCDEHLDGITFVHNGLMPPLPFPDGHFDAMYNLSVFTHLGEETQQAWVQELWRVLKPGGTLISTTHGGKCQHLLATKADRNKYEAGQIVIQGKYREGKKWYFAIHPENYVKNELLKEFSDVRLYLGDGYDKMRQDIWIASKPG